MIKAFTIRLATLLSFNALTISTLAVNTVSTEHFSPTIVDTDLSLLSLSLHIERLSHELYRSGLDKYSLSDFVEDGLAPWAYGRIQEIKEHERAHVEFLETLLNTKGQKVGKACKYNFSYNSPRSFVEHASWLETVGTSAYHGITVLEIDKQFVSPTGAIFAMEERHSGWIDSAVRKAEPWSGAFEVPLNPHQVLTLISRFITSCPSNNPALPSEYPSLEVSSSQDESSDSYSAPDSAHPTPGQTVELIFELPEGYYDSSSPPSSDSLGSGRPFAAFLTSNAGVLFAPIHLSPADSSSFSSPSSSSSAPSSQPLSSILSANPSGSNKPNLKPSSDSITPRLETKPVSRFRKTTQIPEDVRGDVFVFVTKSNGRDMGLQEENMITGPALIRIQFDSMERVE